MKDINFDDIDMDEFREQHKEEFDEIEKCLDELNYMHKHPVGNYKLLAVVSKSKEDADPQLLCICIDNDSNKIGDIIRFDATENNIALIKEVCKNNKTDKKFNEFHDGERAKSLQEVLSMADAIMVD